MIYPLAQATLRRPRSATSNSGGTDAEFNLLVGREIQRDYGQPPQIVRHHAPAGGLDGVNKMSKSLGNYVGITEPAAIMYRQVLQIATS